MALLLYLMVAIRHFDARIEGDLARAQVCEGHLPGIADIIEAGNQHDANVSTFASRLKVFAYFYLVAFFAVIVYIWAVEYSHPAA